MVLRALGPALAGAFGLFALAAAGPAGALSLITATDGSQGWFIARGDLTGTASLGTVMVPPAFIATAPAGGDALRLTTGSDPAARAGLSLGRDFGTVAELFTPDFALRYSWLRPAGFGDPDAAPELRLRFNRPGAATTLVYAPAENRPGGSGPVPTDLWVTETIDLSTGLFRAETASGGSPLLTLDDWRTTLDTANAGLFERAELARITIALGPAAPGITAFFDAVTVEGTGADGGSNFTLARTIAAGETTQAVPLPGALGFLAAGLAGLAWIRRRSDGSAL
ncbi:MAG: hypothetical protein ACFBSD_02620 [Paracoccaceae bacterium]